MKKHRIFLIIFSIGCSFTLWTAINLNNQFESDISIPLRIQNLHPSQAIALPLPTAINVTVRGNGWNILTTKFTPSLFFTIDFQEFHKRGIISTAKEVKDHSNLPNGIVIVRSSPEKIELKLEEKISRTVPITPNVDATYREGFGIVGSEHTEPASVTISGARSLVSGIRSWNTERIVLKDLNMPVSIHCRLQDTLGFEVSLSAGAALLKFDVQPIAERTINEIPIEIVQVPENKHVLLIPPKTSIIIRSGVNNIAGLSEKDFHAFVDYRTILLDTSGMIQPTITGPENVRIVVQQPDRIQYVVRK